MPLLSMEDISISFYGAYANEHVSLSIEPGEIHALLGENGAGKTTLMNILFGIYKAESGRIVWNDKEVRFTSPQEAIAAGIGMVHQHFSLIDAMTALDNIILGDSRNSVFIPRKQLKAKVAELSRHYGLDVNPDKPVGEMSIGEKQRVEILKALYRDIKLLILDEPTAVLTPGESEQLFGVLRQLKSRGFAVILITHRMSEIMANTDRVTVLRAGKTCGTYNTCDTTSQELSRLMIGHELKTVRNESASKPGSPVLETENLTVFRSGRHKAAMEDVTLTIGSGEILGIAGVEGNGQKELAEAIAGIRRHRVKGRIKLNGSDITSSSVSERTAKGVAYIPDDRQRDALVPDMDVSENLLLRSFFKKPFSKFGIFSRKAVADNAEKALSDYQIRTAGRLGIHAPVRMLSGGNQQKIIIAREILPSASLVIASHPTRGLDVSASSFVHEKLMEQKNSGKAVLLISADLEEITALSDRVAVMFGGRIAGILNKDEVTIEKLGILMGGGKL